MTEELGRGAWGACEAEAEADDDDERLLMVEAKDQEAGGDVVAGRLNSLHPEVLLQLEAHSEMVE